MTFTEKKIKSYRKFAEKLAVLVEDDGCVVFLGDYEASDKIEQFLISTIQELKEELSLEKKKRLRRFKSEVDINVDNRNESYNRAVQDLEDKKKNI